MKILTRVLNYCEKYIKKEYSFGNEISNSNSMVVFLPEQHKKEFEIMYELLMDAEKYDKQEFTEASISSLKVLIGVIQKQIETKQKTK